MDQGLQFLIHTLFSLYVMAFVLRVWMQLVQANYFSPVAEFLRKVTNPLVKPLQRIIPTLGRLDLASVFLAVLLTWLKFFILTSLFGTMPHWLVLLIFSIQQLAGSVLMLMFWILLLRAILSWLSQGQNPIEHTLHELTEPLLRPIRRILPPIGGLDLSVLVAIILIQFARAIIG